MWTWAALGSVVFHVGLVLASSLLPAGKEGGAATRDRLFMPGAVIPIETIESMVARAEPIRPSSPSYEDPSAPSKAPTDKPRSSQPSARTGAEPPPDPSPSEAAPAEQPGLLSGQREGARPSSEGVVFDPSALKGSRDAYRDSIPAPGIGEGAVQGPTAPAAGVDYSFKNEKGKLVYRDPHKRFVATLRADGRVDFNNKGAKASMTQIGMAGPGDMLMAARGSDPYARLKAKLLKATFDTRLGMAVGFHKKQINKRLHRLEAELGKIWADERRNLGARKELIFQRWDECDEPEDVVASSVEVPGFGTLDSSELDDARHDAARAARRSIERFVRETAPRGSAEAFSAAELADMNRRRVSRQNFKPYG